MSQLFYYTPSGGDWNKALPIGNGKLGAMIFGEEHEEHFQLNEDSVWFGTKRNRNNADARKNLDKIRELILNGKISEAENLCKYALSGTPQSQHSYQTLGDVYFDFCIFRFEICIGAWNWCNYRKFYFYCSAYDERSR